MTTLVVKSVGPATSVQDAGRYGAQRYGLTPSGAMDRFAAVVANCLVGNDASAALVEIGPLAASLGASGGAIRLALSGAARDAQIGERRILSNTSFLLKDGETLALGVARGGVFSYLAIEGGISGEPTFGSVAVNARAGLGSPFPRPLQANDAFEVATATEAVERQLPLKPVDDGPIRVLLGPQDDEFDPEATRLFLETQWTISATSDRMGYRLEGPPIEHTGGHNIVSDGTVLGSIQIPGNGQPIVLMADRGTSGGYPKIATVISADVGRLAQLPAGTTFQFQAVDMKQSHATAHAFAAKIRGLPSELRDARDVVFNLDELQRANVAGNAISAIDSGTWQSKPDLSLQQTGADAENG